MTESEKSNPWAYAGLKKVVEGHSLPAMVVDLEVLESNTRRMAAIAKERGKTIRVATKSLRVPDLMKQILIWGEGTVRGLMCYSVQEAAFLADQGFDDFLIAYPTVESRDIQVAWELNQKRKKVVLMVDCEAQLHCIDSHWKAKPDSPPLNVCVDVDMSLRRWGQHLGVQRSPIRSLEDFSNFVATLQRRPHLSLAGVMGYEAQVAGLGDNSPWKTWLNPVKRWVRRKSIQHVKKFRREIFDWLEERDLKLELFNGGGTGSLRSTSLESVVTEVAVGSGFLQSQLFDYYEENENAPAFCFGLRVTRNPQAGVVTCHSGGFIASGEAGPDKVPTPFRPSGLKLFSTEGCGEVQTPLQGPDVSLLEVGDPVFFRPAKAGEIAENFNEYLLKKGTQFVGKAKTYRGFGKRFF